MKLATYRKKLEEQRDAKQAELEAIEQELSTIEKMTAKMREMEESNGNADRTGLGIHREHS